MLRSIGEQGAYRFDQLQGLLARHPDTRAADPAFLSETRTYAILQRWQQLGLVVYRKVLHDELGWIWLTAKGLYHVQLALQFHEPAVGDLEHLFWINETRALVEDTYGSRPGFCWESERQFWATRERLRAEQKREPDLRLPLEYSGAHRPDALLRYRTGQEPDATEVVSAIEVELSEKASGTWKKIFIELTRHYSNAHYYVHASVKGSLQKALEKFQAEDPQYGEPAPERRRYIYIHDLEQRL
jgi:hypothetical protein